MSVNIETYGGLDRFEAHVPTLTSKQTMKTFEDDNTTIAGWMIMNNTAGAVTVKLSYDDGDGEIDFYVKSVPAYDTDVVTGYKLRAIKDGILYCTSGASSGITVSLQTVIAASDRAHASRIG